jgi:hypothetical protein
VRAEREREREGGREKPRRTETERQGKSAKLDTYT